MDESSGAAASLIVTEDLATPPLIEIVQRRALCIQAGLDRLATNEMEALVQLEANRDAALAAVRTGRVASVEAAAVIAAFSAGVDAVQAAAARKRTGLETELVEADAAHGELIDAIAALAEVRCDNAAFWAILLIQNVNLLSCSFFAGRRCSSQ